MYVLEMAICEDLYDIIFLPTAVSCNASFAIYRRVYPTLLFDAAYLLKY
jgi:hypothetical protein